MARGINKVILVGNVGTDPEVRYLPNGSPVTNLSIATSETWKDKQTGERQERTEWHRTVLFNRLAEIAAEYVKKGSKIYVEGSLRTRKWQDQSGADRYTTEIIVSDLQMLDSRTSGYPAGQEASSQGAYGQPNQPYANNAQEGGFRDNQSHYGNSSSQQQTPPPNLDNFDDDIPF